MFRTHVYISERALWGCSGVRRRAVYRRFSKMSLKQVSADVCTIAQMGRYTLQHCILSQNCPLAFWQAVASHPTWLRRCLWILLVQPCCSFSKSSFFFRLRLWTDIHVLDEVATEITAFRTHWDKNLPFRRHSITFFNQQCVRRWMEVQRTAVHPLRVSAFYVINVEICKKLRFLGCYCPMCVP